MDRLTPPAAPGPDNGLEIVEAGARPAMPNPPWHYAITKEITQLLHSKPTPSSDDINRAAGLAWAVYQTSAYLYTGDPTTLALDSSGYTVEPQASRPFKLVATPKPNGALTPTFILNVRDDLHQVVGVVKQRYRLVQNHDVPRVLDHLVQDGHADWVAAGLLRGGAEVWWLIRLHDTIAIARDPRETIGFYILLTHSHDGAKKTHAAVIPLRVSSKTVLGWPLERAARTLNITPASSPAECTATADRIRGLANAYRTELERIATQLIQTPLPDESFTAILNRLVPTPRQVVTNGRTLNQRGITMAENAKGTITTIYYNNPTIAHIRGTLWGAIQATQYYSDHHTINRGTDEATPDENHFKRITRGSAFGSTAFTKVRSLAL